MSGEVVAARGRSLCARPLYVCDRTLPAPDHAAVSPFHRRANRGGTVSPEAAQLQVAETGFELNPVNTCDRCSQRPRVSGGLTVTRVSQSNEEPSPPTLLTYKCAYIHLLCPHHFLT